MVSMYFMQMKRLEIEERLDAKIEERLDAKIEEVRKEVSGLVQQTLTGGVE